VIVQTLYPLPVIVTVPVTIDGSPTSANVALLPAAIVADEELLTVIVKFVDGGPPPSG
jgi:hypothetical protein